MKKTQSTIVLVCTILLLSIATSVAQSSAQSQPQQQAASALELYHIHIAKAAPGKLPQLIEAYNNGPAPAANEPQFTPIMLRHRGEANGT